MRQRLEMEAIEVLRKRRKTAEGSEGEGGVDDAGMEEPGAEIEVAPGSQETEDNIRRILEKIDRFTNQVSELLEAGKALLRDLSTEFEDRLIAIHKEHIDKWQEEIKELRMIDAANEAARARLQDAHFHILRSVREEE